VTVTQQSKADQPSPPPTPQAGAKHAAAGATAEPSMGDLVKEASTHVSTLIHGEIELAKLELRSTIKNVGIGAVLFILAGAIALYSLTFGFFALAEALAGPVGLPRWAAFLIVFGLLLVIAGLAVLIGIKLVKKAKAPEKTIKTGKETVAYLKNHG
jgi:uncharacterized membrane protein YqjE